MKNKKVFVINGRGGVGKDSFVDYCSKHASVRNVSTVDKVKVAGKILGWEGVKTEEDREFLSDLKLLADKYYNHSIKYVLKEYSKFILNDEQQLMFIHSREPKNIKLIKENIQCEAILINNRNVKQIDSNMADANVDNYPYDFYIDNSGTLEDLEIVAERFVARII